MIILIDSREQQPFTFGGQIATQKAALQTGDYSILGLESEVSVERKSLQDLIGSLGKGRDRFDRELDRLSKFHTRALVCEGSWAELIDGQYRGQMNPKAAYGSVMGIIAMGIPVVMANSRKGAERACYAILRIAYNRWQWRLRNFAKGKIVKAS